MVGKHKSVFALLKNWCPMIAWVKFSRYKVHLAASKTCLKLPESIEDLLSNVGSNYSRRFSKQTQLKEFHEYLDTCIHQIMSPSKTRFLSLKQCVDQVLDQYEPLKSYFTTALFEDPSKTSYFTLTTLKDDRSF